MDFLMHSCVGTPYYMSPQILNKLPYTAKSESFALGIILYELLFGVTPWHNARTYLDLVGLINSHPITFPSSIPISTRT